MAQDDDDVDVTIYWRPGCLYCAQLLRKLERSDIPHRLVNIWEDPDAAAVVRSHAGGNETVPTAVIGNTALVNPSMRRLRKVYEELASSVN